MNRGKKVILAVGLLLAIPLLPPSGRELTVMNARLLLHLKGKTFVQGQPPGCVTYHIPNVQFTKDYGMLLRSHSDKSPEAFVLAGSMGDYDELKPPPGEVWRGNPLLESGAFRLAGRACEEEWKAQLSNSPLVNSNEPGYGEVARAVVQLAQQTYPNNGALWLAESALDFGDGSTKAALSSLQTAVAKGAWTASAGDFFNYSKGVLQAAGLSRLDAAIGAQAQSPDFDALVICGSVRRHLDSLLLQAAEKGDDQSFSRLTQMLVALGDVKWRDNGPVTHNVFCQFVPSHDLSEAMAKRMGRTVPSNSNSPVSSIPTEVKKGLFRDYLEAHADPATADRFIKQQESGAKETEVFRRRRDAESDAFLSAFLFNTICALLALLMLSLLVVAGLFELLFVKLRQSGCPAGALPKKFTFWFLGFVAIAFGALVMTNFCIAVGTGNPVGFGPVEPPPAISPLVEALANSLLACSAWFVALVMLWKCNLLQGKTWRAVLFFAAAYCVCSLLAAHFRSQLVENIAAQYLPS